MERRTITREVTVEAVKLNQSRGVTVARTARDLAVHGTVLRRWGWEGIGDPQQALPGQGQMKLDQPEMERLRREVTKRQPERDNLQNAADPFAKESR